MIVSCPSCDKKYKLDDEKIKDDGVKVKCTKCETVFVVKPQASVRQFRVRLVDGQELEALALTELILKIQTGVVGPDDLIAGQGEPFSPAGDHPDLEGVKFKKPPEPVVPDKNELPDDDDLFGDGETEEEALFGDDGDNDPFANPKSEPAEDDDLFGSGNDDDDLFGSSNSDSNDDDLFGGAEENSSDEDLFASGKSPEASSGDDIFGNDDQENDDDLFAENSPETSPEDDMFSDAEGTNNDDDMFAVDQDSPKDDDMFGDAEPESSEPDSSDLFGNSSDENLFGADEEESDSNLFEDDESGGAALFEDGGEATGDEYTYEEDLAKKIADNPLEDSPQPPDLFGDDFQVEEGIEDLITAPLDLPELKRSYKSLIIGGIVSLLLVVVAASVYFLPGKLVELPLVGQGVLALHRTLGTQWFMEREGARVLSELQNLPAGYNLNELEKAYKICADNSLILRENKKVEELCARYVMVTVLSQARDVGSFVRKYHMLDGLPGTIIRNLDSRSKIPAGPPSWEGFLKLFAGSRNSNIDEVRHTLANKKFPKPIRFTADLLAADISMDLGDNMEALGSLEKAADTEPENRFVIYHMATMLVKQQHFTEARALLNDLSKKQAHPWLASRLLSLGATIDERNEQFQPALKKASLAIAKDANNLDAVALKADLLNRTGNAIDTLLMLQNYITRFPKNYNLRLQEGIAKEMLGRVKEALSVYKEIAGFSDIRLEAPLHEASLLARTGSIDSAFEIINDLLIKFPEDPAVLLGLGQLEFEKGELDKAEKVLRQVLEKDPSSLNGLLAMGRLRMAKNEITVAEKLFRKANKLDPLHRIGRLELGDVFLRKDKLKKAEEIFSGILESQPQNAQVLLALGKIAYKRKKYTDAEDFFNEALKHSSLPEGYFYLALAARESGKYDEAIQNLKRAISIKDQPRYELAMAKTYSRANKPGTALAVYDDLLARDPKNIAALWASVHLYMKTGDDDHALKRLDQIRSLHTGDPKIEQVLAEIYLRKNRLSDAARAVAKGLRKDKNNIQLLQTAAQIFLVKGDYGKANHYLQKARKLAPRNGMTHFLLGYYYKEAKNELSKAQIEFERALKFGLPDEKKAIAQGELDALRYQ